MHTLTFAIAFIHLVLTVSALTAPYTSETFQSVMDLSKLQCPTADDEIYLPELETYSSEYFQLIDDDVVQFQMSGDSNRCELRERTSGDANAAWSVTDSYTASGSVYLASQEDGLEEFTFLQVHCASGALLRISWITERTSDDFDCTDCIIANVRQGMSDDDDDVPKYFLTDRGSDYVTYEMTVDSSKVYVSVDGTTMVDGVDVSYWEDEDCYFKAGVYNNNPEDESATAVALFNALTWEDSTSSSSSTSTEAASTGSASVDSSTSETASTESVSTGSESVGATTTASDSAGATTSASDSAEAITTEAASTEAIATKASTTETD